jgi:hypothetical protein
MKRCPKCNQAYEEDDLNFCLNDGTPLSTGYNSERTVELDPRRINPPSTISSPSRSQKPLRQGVSPLFAYGLVGLLALLIGGGIVLWVKSDTKEFPSLNQNAQQTAVNSTSPKELKVDSNQEIPKETETPFTAPPPTVESVQILMNRWEVAQDSQNFRSYESCYGYAFRGVLRTKSGRVKVYGFNDWMRDRRQMINQSGGLEVDVKNMRISINGDTATVEFDQYYRSGSYSDWGPKVIRIKSTPEGERIVYEELKASYSL